MTTVNLIQAIVLILLPSAQAQENPLGGNIDLNGIWEIYDEQSNGEMVVFITQTGSQVIASFDPEGDCSHVDMENVKTTLDFHARIEGNQLIGETNVCIPKVNNVELYPMQLTISDDGKGLTGTYQDEAGNHPISYFKTTTTPPPTNLISFPQAEWNFISGYITNPNTDKISAPIASAKFASNYLIASDTDPALFFGILGGISVIGIVAGSYTAIKKIHKHSKSQEKDRKEEEQKLHVIRLAIECGLESNRIEEIKGIKHIPYITEINRIEQECRRALGAILEGREKLKKLQEAKEFVAWCREAKEDPDKILSKISDDVIAKFLGCIEPYFSSLLLNGISVETQTNLIKNDDKKIKDQEEDKNKNIKFNANFALKPLEPYIELILLIDEVKASSVRLIFVIDTKINIKNAKIYSTNRDGSKIDIESMTIILKLSFSRLVINRYLSSSIEVPMLLGKKEFEIKNTSIVSK